MNQIPSAREVPARSTQVLVLEHETEYGWTDRGDAFPTGTYIGNMQVCPGSPGWSV